MAILVYQGYNLKNEWTRKSVLGEIGQVCLYLDSILSSQKLKIPIIMPIGGKFKVLRLPQGGKVSSFSASNRSSETQSVATGVLRFDYH